MSFSATTCSACSWPSVRRPGPSPRALGDLSLRPAHDPELAASCGRGAELPELCEEGDPVVDLRLQPVVSSSRPSGGPPTNSA